MTRRVEKDPDHPGSWRIVNAATNKPVVHNLPEREAREFAERMEKASKKKYTQG